MTTSPPLAAGQHWRTRNGDIVRVTLDRQACNNWIEVDLGRWRWALSNSHIADDDGRVGLNNQEHYSDLMELIPS